MQSSQRLIARKQCTTGMAHVTGDYCTEVDHRCMKWLDPDTTPVLFRRCAKFAPKPRCLGKYRELDYCVDVHEHSDAPGVGLPTNWVSWRDANAMCTTEGKRLCTDAEWTFACEGPETLPHPYGLKRDHAACNNDRERGTLLDMKGDLIDWREPVNSRPRCTSPFGVMNTVGNVGEWAVIEGGKPPFRAAGKGGWWNSGLRSRCRPTTFGHDEFYKGVQVGFRCCSDVMR